MKGDNFYRRDSSKEEDMLTDLPEEIILHILSFVDAKTAVQTSVLNKRCRYLWASLPVINFDKASFEYDELFKDFVHNFLSCRDTSINVFNVSLKSHFGIYNCHVVDSIIEHVIDTPSITTNIEALTILAVCVLSELPKLSVLSIFSDELVDASSPFTRMQTFELICNASSSSAMPQDEQNGKTNIVEVVFLRRS
ncbi:FBD-associated F-box protein At1g66320-like [Vigna radiata var. radiata]|uniref:FBD-associated F-box protein At1g66320-like n=1 Tax=Vigna radiata var. radiata TaxID=3916 RepID=A0A1S3UA60_VIGRR|nr:FBD-associated F-box protein At1g66320-like [Vigna radiata var. radiata]